MTLIHGNRKRLQVHVFTGPFRWLGSVHPSLGLVTLVWFGRRRVNARKVITLESYVNTHTHTHYITYYANISQVAPTFFTILPHECESLLCLVWVICYHVFVWL